MKTLYVTDLDGTFLTKEERISSYSLEKVNALVDRGMLFTYATARSEWSAEKATQGLKLNIPLSTARPKSANTSAGSPNVPPKA